jgi:midasin (ATPase involved in ribosome maturation)
LCDFRLTVSVRDLLTWVHFINVVSEHPADQQDFAIDIGSAYVHGACLTFLDSLGSGPTSGARYIFLFFILLLLFFNLFE